MTYVSMHGELLQTETLGLIDYAQALGVQHDFVTARIENRMADTLLICEHPPVVTCGRGVGAEEVSQLKSTLQVPLIQVSRGGGVTAHEPGQLVIYPILKIQPHQLRHVLSALEAAIAKSLRHLGLCPLTHLPGETGVWIPQPSGIMTKIASIGLACKRWVTYHGLALNVCNDLQTFSKINPCGLASNLMSSVWEQQQLLAAKMPNTPHHNPVDLMHTVTSHLIREISAEIQRLPLNPSD
ncbi:MAG: lipoyl(octanoyl) transferase LipB [Vampirovibrionales bacterium]|nr:lipoyl(octanoyl) transferase LipB [Vampirovibrionales bacterium]